MNNLTPHEGKAHIRMSRAYMAALWGVCRAYRIGAVPKDEANALVRELTFDLLISRGKERKEQEEAETA